MKTHGKLTRAELDDQIIRVLKEIYKPTSSDIKSIHLII